MGIGAAIGGGAALGAAGQIFGTITQARAASRARKEAQQAGQQAQGILQGSLYGPQGSLNAVNQGFAQGQNYLNQANQLLGTGYGRLDQAFGQERAIGSEGLDALRNAILGGGQGLQLDPGYQFRLQQGEQALNRAANAAGLLGSSAGIKNLLRFNQDLASNEYQNQVNRLALLGNIGQQANANYANLGQNILNSQAQVLGNQSNLASQQGTSLANLFQQNAIARANSLTGNATQAANLGLAGQNAVAQGIGGLANIGSNALGQYAFLNAINRQPQGFSPAPSYGVPFAAAAGLPGTYGGGYQGIF